MEEVKPILEAKRDQIARMGGTVGGGGARDLLLDESDNSISEQPRTMLAGCQCIGNSQVRPPPKQLGSPFL